MRRCSLSLLTLGIALCIAYASTSNAQEKVAVAIVINRSNKVGDMSVADVRKLFMGDKELCRMGSV